MGGAKNFVIEMHNEQAEREKDPEMVYMVVSLRAAQREAKMLREQLKWLEAHHKRVEESLLKILSLNQIALP